MKTVILSTCKQSIYSTSSYIVDPKFPYDDIMNGNDHFVPSIVAAWAMEHNMHSSNGKALEVLSSKFTSQSVLLPEGPVLVLTVHSQHWRMVADLQEIYNH